MRTEDRNDTDAASIVRGIADELKAESGARFSKYSPEQPSVKQLQFINSNAHECLFGGGVGGGKSSGLLMAFLRDVHIPGYRGLILRKTMGEAKLSGGPLQRAKSWWYGRSDVHWNEENKTFTFPSGATLTFGYLDLEDHIYQYQGTEWHFIGFDELTHFEESSYFNLVLERQRRTLSAKDAGIVIRARSTANPEGKGFPWVTKHFVNPGHPARHYIASTLHDNPGLDIEDYLTRLDHLTPERRRRMVEGIWDPEPPATAIWKADYLQHVTTQELEARKDFKYVITVLALDPAVTSRDKSDDSGIVIISVGNDGKLYIRGDVTGKYSPNAVAQITKNTWRMIKPNSGHLRVRYESNQGGDYVGEMLKATFDPADSLGVVKGIPSRVSKEERAYPIAQQYERGNIYHVLKTREHPDGTIEHHNGLADLEREMLFWNPVLDKRKSPNRLDALVIGCTDLLPFIGKARRETTTVQRLNVARQD
jgi:phage terminase large subunit-like protein